MRCDVDAGDVVCGFVRWLLRRGPPETRAPTCSAIAAASGAPASVASCACVATMKSWICAACSAAISTVCIAAPSLSIRLLSVSFSASLLVVVVSPLTPGGGETGAGAGAFCAACCAA